MSINESGGTSFIGPSGSFSFSTSASPITKRTEDQTPVLENSVNAEHLLMSYLADSDLRKELFQLFSEFINPFHQFVEPSMLDFYAYDSNGPVTILVRYAILAAGSRLSKRQEADQIGDCFALHAESLALKCCRDYPSLIVIQVLTIMCGREISLENENMAWMYNCPKASLVRPCRQLPVKQECGHFGSFSCRSLKWYFIINADYGSYMISSWTKYIHSNSPPSPSPEEQTPHGRQRKSSNIPSRN